MGFGTLFIGYFLLLNVTNFGITDVIASSVMLLGFYKLSGVNKEFRYAYFTDFAFVGISVFELILTVMDMFFGVSQELLLGYLSAVRFVIVGAVSLLMLLGIKAVAKEVELGELSGGCIGRIVVTSIVFSACLFSEMRVFTALFEEKVLLYIFVGAIIGQLIAIGANLVTIYSSYMKICMPEDNLSVPKEAKPSRFEFINSYRERKAERAREEEKYRMEILKKRQEKNRKRKK